MTSNRAEIPAKYKWDLTAIYSDIDAFNADFDKARELIAAFPAFETKMNESAEGLYDTLAAITELERIISKLYEYASRNSDLDKSVSFYLALEDKVMNLINDYGAASFFVSPALVRLDSKKLKKWYKEFPKLENYRRVIAVQQRYQPYTLSDESEKLMADLQNSLHSHENIRSIFAAADLKFGKIRNEEGKPVTLTDSTYTSFLMSTDRRVRRAAFNKIYETYDQFGNTFASLMNSFVKEKVNLAHVRGYENSLQASVFNDEVTPDIYNNLIDTVNKNLPALYDYYDLKREVLGLPKLHLYDIYTPLIQSSSREYSFEEAIEEVLDTVKIYGDEYHDTLEDGLKNQRWCDVYPTTGKRGGAYSSGCYDTQPYILLNYNGKLDDVSTLAHEAGHSMHSYFSRKNNDPQNSEYTIFVAEVASTVNELLLAHKKLRESDSTEEKLNILNQLLETYKGTLFRQTMFAEFEKDMHQLVTDGESLTRELLCGRYYELVRRYFGPRVVIDKQIAMEWMRIPHFYYNFYVYKYSTCISAASGIVKRIENEGAEYIDKYLSFLKCGGSKSPLESLALAGIDLSQPQVIEDAIEDFKATIAQFRELYNSIK